jgi:para-nitrobenzyl esterase
MADITRRRALGGLAATLALPQLARPDSAWAATDGLRVKTRAGVVRGRMAEGVRVFTGIPYGTAARFAAPAPARPWTGEWDATRPARAAPQPPGMDPLPAIQAEDCLQLNVWAPAARGARYPVLVFVHGGSNETGWSGWEVIAGNRFAAHGVICVTLNYRLGALGSSNWATCWAVAMPAVATTACAIWCWGCAG